VTVPDLPVGYQLSQDQFQLFPTYRSGTLVVVGNDATVVLDGTLVDRTGTPLALLAGEIVSLDRKDAITGQFFTNRGGRFRIEGVGPGTFELRLARYPGVNAHVTISPETKGVYVVGEIKLAVEAGSEAAK
jgi:outer membrane usher protein